MAKKKASENGSNKIAKKPILSSQNFGLFIFMIYKIINEFHGIV